jgi:hypothetical protein
MQVLEDAIIALARTAQDPKVPFSEREDRIQVERIVRDDGRDDSDGWSRHYAYDQGDAEAVLRYRIDCTDQGPDGSGPEIELFVEFERAE